MTLHVLSERAVKGRPVAVRRQVVTRTGDRIHVATDDGREWFFERNPVDPRRVSAMVVEHAAKAIVEYEESDLRMTLGIRGWADVLLLGFDMKALADLNPTAAVRNLDGARCVRYATPSGSGEGNEVWWNADRALICQYTLKEAGSLTRLRIERLSTTANADLLRPPAERFPGHRVRTLADWLERH